jgi:hypothetical protein
LPPEGYRDAKNHSNPCKTNTYQKNHSSAKAQPLPRAHFFAMILQQTLWFSTRKRIFACLFGKVADMASQREIKAFKFYKA